MIEVICDRCGKNCDNVAYDIQVNMIHDPIPRRIRDVGQPCITDEPSVHMRFILCQDCERRLGFPNIYSVDRKGLKFDEKDYDEDEKPLSES